MSYTIFKQIRFDKDGSMSGYCTDNNVFSVSKQGRSVRQFKKFNSRGYSNKYPEMNPEEIKTLFFIESLHGGNIFYEEKWKKMLIFINGILRELNFDNNLFYQNLKYKKEIINKVNEITVKDATGKKKYIIEVPGERYIERETKSKLKVTFDKNAAKVYELGPLERHFLGENIKANYNFLPLFVEC